MPAPVDTYGGPFVCQHRMGTVLIGLRFRVDEFKHNSLSRVGLYSQFISLSGRARVIASRVPDLQALPFSSFPYGRRMSRELNPSLESKDGAMGCGSLSSLLLQTMSVAR